MIQASELRLGNFIRSLNGLLVQVQGITATTLTVNDELHATSRQAPVTYFTAIALTAGMLEKCGFEQAPGKDAETVFVHRQLAANLYLQQDGDHAFSLSMSNDGDRYIEVLRTLTTVHELQNCFYALTGKELEIRGEPVA